MQMKTVRILDLEDDEVDHMALLRAVKEMGLPYDVDRAASIAEANDLLGKSRYDVVLLDYMVSDGTGLDLLDKIKGIPSIFITGSGNEMVAVKAIKGGAYDYLIKDTARMYLELLPITIERALRNFRMQEEKIRAEEALKERLGELERLNLQLLQREDAIRELKNENERLLRRIEELERVI